MTKEEQFKLIRLLAESKKFNKINFAGGEPTLVHHICELIKFAKLLGFETSIVTNASKIDFEWIKNIAKHLDILTLSIDSINEETNIASGRNKNKECISKDKLKEIANACHLFGVNLKVNTVVSKFNQKEILSDFINELRPFRWKILQATRVKGQNDLNFDEVKVNSEEFLDYCNKNTINILPDIKVIRESEILIQGSYLMIDQCGRFFDSNSQKHNYSGEILKKGVEEALREIYTDFFKFEAREGNYTTIKK